MVCPQEPPASPRKGGPAAFFRAPALAQDTERGGVEPPCEARYGSFWGEMGEK